MKLLSSNRNRTAVAMSLASVISLASMLTMSAQAQGIPKRVEQLEAELAVLQTTLNPVEVAVNCGAGESIGGALTDHGNGTGKLTILISGVCNEAIVISRSNVTLQGQAGAVVQSPTNTVFSIAVGANVNNVTIGDLTVTGSGTAGVLANQGAHVVLRNATIHTAGSGAMALDNGVINVTGSTLRNNAQGAYAARGGVVNVTNSTVSNNQIGVLAFKGGTVVLTSSTPEFTAGVGPVVRNNNIGAMARTGGLVELSDTIIENNTQFGIYADAGGTVQLFSHLWSTGTGNRISGNALAGLQIGKNSNLAVSDLTNVITGNGRGITCNPDAAYAVPAGFAANVTGNTSGDILGCTP